MSSEEPPVEGDTVVETEAKEETPAEAPAEAPAEPAAEAPAEASAEAPAEPAAEAPVENTENKEEAAAPAAADGADATPEQPAEDAGEAAAGEQKEDGGAEGEDKGEGEGDAQAPAGEEQGGDAGEGAGEHPDNVGAEAEDAANPPQEPQYDEIEGKQDEDNADDTVQAPAVQESESGTQTQGAAGEQGAKSGEEEHKAAEDEHKSNAEPAGEAASSAGIICEILIMPEHYTHVQTFHPQEKIAFIKETLAQRFQIAPQNVRLMLPDVEMMDDHDLLSYVPADHQPTEPIKIVMTIEYLEEVANQSYTYEMPDVLEVRVPMDDGDFETVTVKIVRENLQRKKPFLGGFRHKLTRLEYHHASSQTVRKTRRKGVQKFHRETQTVKTSTRSQQTAREIGTQMERRDLKLDHSKDEVIASRPYFTAENLDILRNDKAKEIQCFLRQCFSWRKVRRLRDMRYQKQFEEVEEREQKEAKAMEEHQRQIDRRMHPRNAQDFDILYKELEAWRLHESTRIKNSGASPEVIQQQLEELLGKEVKLLQTIDRLKITATKENKEQKIKETLEKMASPKEWSSSEGDLVEVETPFTMRAKELVELYNGLKLTDIPKAQRIDVLLHVKYTVKEFDCDLTRDIVELIKREENLLKRGRSEKSLDGLRKRLSNLFLQFVEAPEFNPEASNFRKVPFVDGLDAGSQDKVASSAGAASGASTLSKTDRRKLSPRVAPRSLR